MGGDAGDSSLAAKWVTSAPLVKTFCTSPSLADTPGRRARARTRRAAWYRSAMPYVEEREFTFRFELRCEFPDDYQGEEDGFEWARAIPGLTSDVLRAAVQAIGRHPGWRIHPRNRGVSSDREITLVLERVVEPARPADEQ